MKFDIIQQMSMVQFILGRWLRTV